MLWIYTVASAALVLLSNNFFEVFQKGYSWWLVPLLFVGFWLVLILIHAAVVVVSVWLVRLDSPPERFSRYYRWLIAHTLPMVLTLAKVNIEVTGEDKVPQNSRFLLVCNHLHDFDPAVILYALPDAELGFVGKKEIYTTMPFVARAMHKLHCLPIDRENNREAVKSIISAAKLISDDVVSIGIFPEGYCSKDGELQPMRNGAFKIAYKAKVPIVVCTIDHTPEILKNMFRRKTIVHFDILETISVEQLESMNSSEVGDHVFEIMQKNILLRREQEKNT